MNKRTFLISAVFVTALALSLSVFAQPAGGLRGPGPGGPGGMRGGAMGMGIGGLGMFVRNAEFVKMLEMTPEQVENVQKIVEDAREQFRPQPGTPPNFEEMQKRMEELQTKTMNVLKPEQQAKFREIHFQAAGGLETPFLNDRMLEVLNLSAEQKDKLRQMQEERAATLREAFQNRNFREMSEEERQKMRTDFEAQQTKFRDQVKGLLTDEQKGQAEKLSAGASELREKLGIGVPGQRFERGRRGGAGQGGDGYRPGSGSWRPGQGAPNGGGPPSGAPGNRRFPRSETPQ